MQLDNPLHLYNNPANKFVAGFIGPPAMNFIGGTIQQNDGYYFIHQTIDSRISLGAAIAPALENYIGKPIQLGLRPEHIIICEENNGNNFDCTLPVIAYENMGNEQLIYLSLATQTLIARRPSTGMIDTGTEKRIRFLADKIIYFDEQTGEVICTS